MADIINQICDLSKFEEHIVLKYIIRMIMKSTHLIGAEYIGALYKELPNQWHHRDDFTEEELEKSCNSYWECDANFDKINVDSEYIKYIWKQSKYNSVDDINYYFECECECKIECECEEVNENTYEYLKNLYDKKEQIFFNGKLHIYNNDGINDDHRHSDHCELNLPFEPEVILQNPTLDELIMALYKLKSHKFEDHYELYCGCKITNVNDGYKLELEFDHGS